MSKTLTIELSEEAAAIIEAAVASGDFASASDVVAVALVGFETSREPDPLEDIQYLRKAWDEGIRSGEGMDADQFFDQLEAAIAARQA